MPEVRGARGGMMEEFDFQRGGELHGKRYPKLKTLGESIVYVDPGIDRVYYHYEPGNMTRYEVIFSELSVEYDDEPMTVMTVMCPRQRCMVIPHRMFHMYDLDYMMEKLEMLEGDCYALIQLINHHLGRIGAMKPAGETNGQGKKMRMTEISDSSSISGIGYDPDSSELRVEFANGGALYRYKSISPMLFARLMASESRGSFLAREIIPSYKGERIEE